MTTNEMTESSTDEVTEGAATLTAVEIATHLAVSPKSLRRFIRSTDAACGKGNRYAFDLDEAKALIAAFNNRPTRNAPTARSADEVAALLAD